jgi:hypothetical protein
MDTCEKVQGLLADYRAENLGLRKSASVEGHLRQCPDCANELRVLDDVLALLEANMPECEPPVGLWNGVHNRITSPEPIGHSVRDWISRPIRAAGIGVAALALAIGLMISTGPREHITPVQLASNMEYVQGHALYAGQAPLADRVSYLSVVAASSETQVK